MSYITLVSFSNNFASFFVFHNISVLEDPRPVVGAYKLLISGHF